MAPPGITMRPPTIGRRDQQQALVRERDAEHVAPVGAEHRGERAERGGFDEHERRERRALRLRRRSARISRKVGSTNAPSATDAPRVDTIQGERECRATAAIGAIIATLNEAMLFRNVPPPIPTASAPPRRERQQRGESALLALRRSARQPAE